MKQKLFTVLMMIALLMTGCGANQGEAETAKISDGRYIEAEDSIFDFAIDEEYLYYQGQAGEIYQRPLSALEDDTQRKTIAEIPYEDLYYVGYPYATIYEENGSVFYRYHSGGATMGGDYLYRINGEQEPQKILGRNYDDYTQLDGFGIHTFGAGIGSPGIGMMYVSEHGTSEQIGPELYRYCVQGDSYDAKRNVLYVMANSYDTDTRRLSQIDLYELHLSDGVLTKLSDAAYENYDVTKDAIYYQALQNLYMFDLNTREEKIIVDSDDFVYHYAGTENGVFYACVENQNKLSFWNREKDETIQYDLNAEVVQLYDQNGYVVAHFAKNTENVPQTIVFFPDGKQIYTIEEAADKVAINQEGVMVYRVEGTRQLVKVQL